MTSANSGPGGGPGKGATPPDRSAAARARLLAAASELFYAEGVQSVGIDRVIEHAGVAKATPPRDPDPAGIDRGEIRQKADVSRPCRS